jgi:hypothetical protein
MEELKPQWMTEHEASDKEHFREINEKLDGLLNTLKPISETYTTVSTMGKWAMAALVFISVLIGIIAGLKALWGK